MVVVGSAGWLGWQAAAVILRLPGRTFSAPGWLPGRPGWGGEGTLSVVEQPTGTSEMRDRELLQGSADRVSRDHTTNPRNGPSDEPNHWRSSSRAFTWGLTRMQKCAIMVTIGSDSL